MKPVRVQLRRTKGWRMPPNTVKVDRSTPYGNPVPVGWMEQEVVFCGLDCLRARVFVDPHSAVEIFRMWLEGEDLDRLPLARPDLAPLRGKNLACWCPLDQPCHADVLLELVNRSEASADTHPTGGDAKQAPATLSGAVPHEDAADAQTSSPLPGSQP